MIRLLVGLGNPGSDYTFTRHNAGFWLVEQLAAQYKTNFSNESKFFAQTAKFSFKGQDVWLLKPQTYMNLSGKSVQALAGYYKILPSEILVAHDELDFEPGVARFKQGGGAGGHNGLKDIDRVMGKDYWRVRIGIGHPGDRNKVADYVLKKPLLDEKIAIDNSINKVSHVFDLVLSGDMNSVMKEVHSK